MSRQSDLIDLTRQTIMESASETSAAPVVVGVENTGRAKRTMLAQGSYTATTFLCGDGTWKVPASSAHNHSATEITSGTIGIARLPTGTTSTTVCLGNDGRLSDARTPLSHAHSAGDVPSLDALTAPAASVNFNNQQAVAFRLENRTSDPANPVVGQMWIRTDL